MNEMVSVVVPIYGVEDYLENCVNSILNQTYKNIEIILVDDGSPDKCGKICDDYAILDSRVKVLHKKNGGLSDARNVGIEVACGKYITFIDSDDYISEDYISVLLKSLMEEDADISICKLKATSNLKEDVSSKTQEGIFIYSTETAIEEMLYSKEFSTSACGRMFCTNLFDDVRFPVGRYSEDLFTIYRIILQSKKIVFVKREAYFYYTRPGSITNEKFSIKQLDTIDALHFIKREVVDYHKNLYPAYMNSIVEAVARLLKMNIPKKALYANGLWEEVKKYRKRVFLDKKASKRVRTYAFLMLIGPEFTSKVMRIYYKMKWRKS